MVYKNFDQIREIITLNSKPPKWIEEARSEHETLKALVYGEKYKEEIIRIEHLEVEKRINERRKYSKSIQGLNQRLLITLDNIYSATGGNKEYPGIMDMNDADQKAFMSKITKVRDNKSIEKFLQNYWVKDLHVVDPNGLLMLEYKGDDIDSIKPTYKSILKIRNIETSGQLVEWVLFEPFEMTYLVFKEKYQRIIEGRGLSDDDIIYVIRLVDDETDWLAVKVNDELIEVDGLIFKHPFGRVPAMTCSERSRLGSQKKLSFIHDIIDDEKEYLRDQSVLTLYKYKNGFPIPYMPKLVCPQCKGRKKDGEHDCSMCGGKGEIMTKDVVDEITLYIDLDNPSDVKLPNNWAGYIIPPIEPWDQYIKELDRSEDSMNFVLYGSRLVHEVDQTATARFIDQQPVNNSLNPISDTAQFMEKMFTEWIANFMFLTKPKNKPVSIIQYGKRYLLELPDTLLEKYIESCDKGMPAVIKDRQLSEYLTSKYKNDMVTLKAELLKKEVEPYVHYHIDIVNKIFGITEARKKILFNDFWETLEPKDFNKNKDQLTSDFEQWFGKLNFEDNTSSNNQD